MDFRGTYYFELDTPKSFLMLTFVQSSIARAFMRMKIDMQWTLAISNLQRNLEICLQYSNHKKTFEGPEQ